MNLRVITIFGSRNFTNEIWALETPETRKSAKGLSVTLCVNLINNVMAWAETTFFGFLVISVFIHLRAEHAWGFMLTVKDSKP